MSKAQLNLSLLGELEKTTMNSFCESGNLKAFLQRTDLRASVRETALRYAGARAGKSEFESKEFDGRSTAELPTTASEDDFGRKQRSAIDSDVKKALLKIEGQLKKSISQDFSIQEEVIVHTHVTVNGKTFSSTNSPSANVFCHTTKGLIPCVIRQIFSMYCPTSSRGDDKPLSVFFFAVVQLHRPPKATIENPFQSWEEFGANIWSKNLYDDISIQLIRQNLPLVHAIQRDWDEFHIVAKPLTRVRSVMHYR